MILAESLKPGHIIRHFTGDIWQVYGQPEYTNSGIEFEVLSLNTSSQDTQKVCFHPQWRFELVESLSIAA